MTEAAAERSPLSAVDKRQNLQPALLFAVVFTHLYMLRVAGRLPALLALLAAFSALALDPLGGTPTSDGEPQLLADLRTQGLLMGDKQ